MNIAILLTLLPVFILLICAALIVVLRIARPDFGYYWLIAAGGALFAWPAALISRSYLPQTIPLTTWRPEWMFSVSPSLLVDKYTWPYAFALCTLGLAVILTDIVRAGEADWISWSSSLFIIALGILAVQAANPLTLLLTWTAIDLAEVLILLWHIPQSIGRERVVIAFFSRIAGVFLLIWADLSARSSGSTLEFQGISQQASIYILLAALLRLGVLPLHQPFLHQVEKRRSLGTISRLISAAASFSVFTRLASTGIGDQFATVFLFAAGFFALYAAVSWLFSTDELDGRPFWIIAFGIFTAAAAVRGQPEAAQAWGIAAVLSGGLLFLFSVRNQKLLPLALLGLIGISMLPYSPSWQGAYLYAPPFRAVLVLYFLAQLILFLGYVRHALRREETSSITDRWIWVIFPWGLALLPLSHFIIGFLDFPEGLTLVNVLPSVITILLAFSLYFLARRLPINAFSATIAKRVGAVFSRIFSLEWLYRVLWRGYSVMGQGITYFFRVIEGDGGILWALLFLVLLVAIVAQIRSGI